MTDKRFTILDQLAERNKIANDLSYEKRHQESRTDKDRIMLGYYEGKSSAYSEAHTLVKKEMERLRNLYQNGALSMDSFNLDY